MRKGVPDLDFPSGKIINMADKIMVIEDGEVKKYGTKEDVFPTLFQQEKCQKCLNEGGKC